MKKSLLIPLISMMGLLSGSASASAYISDEYNSLTSKVPIPYNCAEIAMQKGYIPPSELSEYVATLETLGMISEAKSKELRLDAATWWNNQGEDYDESKLWNNSCVDILQMAKNFQNKFRITLL